MSIETTIRLNKFKPREYQKPILDALNRGFKRVLAIIPRRAGKDITVFNWCVRKCLEKPIVCWYIFPTFSQGRKVIWDTITNDGVRFLDFVPPETIDSISAQEMRIRYKNGSIFQVIGSNDYDKLMGANPTIMVFSEYAMSDPKAFQLLSPILRANAGIGVFISTPRGKNHLWSMYQIALNSPDWFVLKLSLDDTQHIPLSEIEKEKQEGFLNDDLIQQEYYCSFECGIEGSYYAKYIDKMRMDGRIGECPWEPQFKVHLAIDIGVRDMTTIIFFQVIGQTVRIIDTYSNSKLGLEHYAKIIQQKPYQYGKMIAPHDIKVQEWGTGLTRIEKAKSLGINFTVAPDLSIEDGIEAVRSNFNKLWIDQTKCVDLVKALENYRQEWDDKHKVYKRVPLHDWSSHWADAMRYLVISLPKTADGLSARELDARYNKAMYGVGGEMPDFFRDDRRY